MGRTNCGNSCLLINESLRDFRYNVQKETDDINETERGICVL